VAVWYSSVYKLRLSAFAAQVLAECGEIDINKLGLHREFATGHYLSTGLTKPQDPASMTLIWKRLIP
jgi:hypothetical protein